MLDVDDDPNEGALPLRDFDLRLFSFLPFVLVKSTSLSKLLMDLLNIGLELLSFSFASIRGV